MKAVDSIHPRTKAEVSPQALHSQADVILGRLETWGVLDIQGRGRWMLLSAMEMGAGRGRMFRHMLQPSACRLVLNSLGASR